MLNKGSLKFLEDLMMTSSPSGYEAAAAKCFRDYLAPVCDRVECDVMGNTIAVLNPGAPMRVMLAGHYDEIGFQIVYISEEGLLYFRPNGGIDKLNVPSSEVTVWSASGPIPGVIGKKPIHLLKESERNTPPELADLWIDIGAESRAEAAAIVSVGDPVTMRCNFRRFGKHRFVSKGTDDKIGAFVVAETMRALAKRKLAVAVYGVGTVQEEVGLRGSATSCFGIDPAVGFAVDVGFATDIPDVPKRKLGDIRLGAGPVLTRSCDNNVVLGELMRRVAAKKKLVWQESAAHRATGGTDAARLQLNRSGVATALISIPNRYMHSQVEMCDLRDAEGAVAVLTETIAALTGKESFVPVL